MFCDVHWAGLPDAKRDAIRLAGGSANVLAVIAAVGDATLWYLLNPPLGTS